MVIIGAGGHAKVILEILRKNGVNTIEFWVDSPSTQSLGGYKVIQRSDTSEDMVIIGIGDNRTRKLIVENNNYSYGKAIHPTAIIASDVRVKNGTAIMPGAIINTGAEIGNHVIVNTAAVLDHEVMLGDFVHISPNATLAGAVTVGEGAWIGAGAVVIQGAKVGKWATIGAGAVIVNDVPDYAVVVGVPGRIIKYNMI